VVVVVTAVVVVVVVPVVVVAEFDVSQPCSTRPVAAAATARAAEVRDAMTP